MTAAAAPQLLPAITRWDQRRVELAASKRQLYGYRKK